MPTKELVKIEKEGASWAMKCALDLLSLDELRFFANEYKPFYGLGGEGTNEGDGVVFDPFEQHKMCSLLFAPAFGSCGARMLSRGNGRRIPDQRFAAFERGAIEMIKTVFCTDS